MFAYIQVTYQVIPLHSKHPQTKITFTEGKYVKMCRPNGFKNMYL